MNFTVLCKYFKELFFGIANIQLYFHATKYLSIYFRQISNFFVGLLERESLYSNKERSICFEHPFIIWLLSTPQIYTNIFKYTTITEIFSGISTTLTFVKIFVNKSFLMHFLCREIYLSFSL